MGNPDYNGQADDKSRQDTDDTANKSFLLGGDPHHGILGGYATTAERKSADDACRRGAALSYAMDLEKTVAFGDAGKVIENAKLFETYLAGTDTSPAPAGAYLARPGFVVVEEMVSRFLSWKLPADFNPDGGISFERYAMPGRLREPVGTNLLTASQAEAMVRHLLGIEAPAT
jgi:hypothetical protein